MRINKKETEEFEPVNIILDSLREVQLSAQFFHDRSVDRLVCKKKENEDLSDEEIKNFSNKMNKLLDDYLDEEDE